MKVLAVIPARGGSKRIKHKNLRLIHGKPLLAYILDVAISCRYIDDIVVSTDDQGIAEYARERNVKVRIRPAELSGDDVTLDPVVYDALRYMEDFAANTFDIVITLQPTSPTLKTQTLEKALLFFINSQNDSVISVVDDTHLEWRIDDGNPIPFYEKRLNRQWLPKTYKETGAFVISRRNVITLLSRFGKKIAIYPVSREEAIDIDDEIDWLIATALLARLRFAIVVNGNRQLGMGHVYRTLTLADVFFGNTIRFFTYDSDTQAIKLVKEEGYDIEVLPNLVSLQLRLSEYRPDIIINDILDTDCEYMRALRSDNCFIVNFEDLGEGSSLADLVFNALYEFSTPPPHHRYGPRYVSLGRNFLLTSPAPFREPATTLLITFGGSDDNNLTIKTCKTIPRLLKETSLDRVIVVLGPSYSHHKEFSAYLETMDEAALSHIQVYDTVRNMAQLMREADVAVTSNGRTIYELSAMGVPGVSIAQNDRETLHLFSRYSRGFRYLGIACNVRVEDILESVRQIVMDRDLRRNMREALLATDLRKGVYRVQREILDQYWRWKYENTEHR